jgi:hypothetical protein
MNFRRSIITIYCIVRTIRFPTEHTQVISVWSNTIHPDIFDLQQRLTHKRKGIKLGKHHMNKWIEFLYLFDLLVAQVHHPVQESGALLQVGSPSTGKRDEDAQWRPPLPELAGSSPSRARGAEDSWFSGGAVVEDERLELCNGRPWNSTRGGGQRLWPAPWRRGLCYAGVDDGIGGVQIRSRGLGAMGERACCCWVLGPTCLLDRV